MSIVTSCLVAGMDVHKRFVVVVVLDSSRPDEPVASGKYGTTFPELEELTSFLHKHEGQQVAMESTAQYWRPVWGRAGRPVPAETGTGKIDGSTTRQKDRCRRCTAYRQTSTGGRFDG